MSAELKKTSHDPAPIPDPTCKVITETVQVHGTTVDLAGDVALAVELANEILRKRGLNPHGRIDGVIIFNENHIHIHGPVGKVESKVMSDAEIRNIKNSSFGNYVADNAGDVNQEIGGDLTVSNTVSQEVTKIQKGDFSSLSHYFKSQGLSDEDLSKLKSAIDEDPKPTSPQTFGAKLKSWIFDMGLKEVATGMAVAALSKYFGFSG